VEAASLRGQVARYLAREGVQYPAPEAELPSVAAAGYIPHEAEGVVHIHSVPVDNRYDRTVQEVSAFLVEEGAVNRIRTETVATMGRQAAVGAGKTVRLSMGRGCRVAEAQVERVKIHDHIFDLVVGP